MAKNLKINIKNSKLAEALKLKKSKLQTAGKKKATAKKKASIKKSEEETSKTEEKTKRKARIVKAKVEKKPDIKEEKKDIKPTKSILEEKNEPIVETKKPATEEKSQSSSSISSKKIDIVQEMKRRKKENILDIPQEKLEKETTQKKPEETKKAEEKKEKPKQPEKPSIYGKVQNKTKEIKLKKHEPYKKFDSRARQGLSNMEDDQWRRRKRYSKAQKTKQEIPIVRPSSLTIKTPILLKDLAAAMKLKASELITKLFTQGIPITLNDYLDDDTTIQLLGHEFNCEITIDKSVEKKIQITTDSIKEEIKKSPEEKLKLRNPIITFMGHVDHGKTSIIDSIRKSNIASGEAGAITQHIGAFAAKTSLGEITILDTPGHEAFTEMRARGANVTDIVVLVIAGDEGIRDQTIEAMNQAKEANVPIIVAINKSDKENFDPDKVYRQLADHDLLPEAWGGSTITVNCSALTGKGIDELLEMVSLQSEILELKADPSMRARGTILESQMHKGLGSVATVLVQNGTLKQNDAFVFGGHWGKVKTMHDQNGNRISQASPSEAAKITGLSNLAEAGSEMIVVKDEKEAKDIAKERSESYKREKIKKAKTGSLEKLLKKQEEIKILPLIIRADVQGSLEALEQSLSKIHSKKVKLNIISSAVGEISESDIELANASKATILGFHTHIENHAEGLIKFYNISILQHNIIYHAIDDIKEKMKVLLDKIEEEKDAGKALVKTVFSSSQLGKIAGCLITDGHIKRSHFAKIIRDDEIVWKGKIASLKRHQDDVKEVQKGVECGIVLENFGDIKENDVIQAFEIIYKEQEL